MSKLFAIGLEVEEVAVGRVLRQLDGMTGVAKINLNLTGQKRGEVTDEAEDDPVRALTAPVTAKGSYNKKVDTRGRLDQTIAEALKNGELHSVQLRTFLQRRGFSHKSLASLLNRMFTDRLIERGAGLGVWKLTPAGMKHFFGNQKSQSSVSNRPNRLGRGGNFRDRGADNRVGIRRVVLDLLRTGPKPTAEVTRALTEHGKSAKNMSGTVYKMRIDPPSLVKLTNGMYSLTPHGEAEIERITQAEQSQQSPQPQAAE